MEYIIMTILTALFIFILIKQNKNFNDKIDYLTEKLNEINKSTLTNSRNIKDNKTHINALYRKCNDRKERQETPINMYNNKTDL